MKQPPGKDNSHAGNKRLAIAVVGQDESPGINKS